MQEFQKNSQGFVIIDTNTDNKTFMRSIDGCMQFDFLDYEISVSTGSSVLKGGCLIEILVTDPENREHLIRGTVQDAIMFVIQREKNGRTFNTFNDAMDIVIEEV